MPIYISSTELEKQLDEVADTCINNSETVFITKDGKVDLVMLSRAEYDRLCGHAELDRLLQEGFDDIQAGRCKPIEEVFAELERRFNLDDHSSNNT